MNIVTAVSLSRRFGDFTAVDQVDLTVAAGEIVGVLGANGAGKTTLMRMILGLLRPSGGSVLLFGEAPSRRTRLRIGYMPQGLGLYKDLTAAENLAFAAASFGVRPLPVPAGAESGQVGNLPLGVQRQVAFAAALQHKPELLVLDEPSSGVAPLARAQLWDRIRDQAASGTAVLVTTHYMDEARQADRLILLARGRVVGRGTESDIVGDARAVVVDTDDWSGAFAALEAAGQVATLAGRRLRVPGADPAAIGHILKAAGVGGSTTEEAATLEEAMVLAEEPQ
jgi:ABC-2 type transport system ATP-binding protein